MHTMWIAGLGPGNGDKITAETLAIMRKADLVILRTAIHPAAEDLPAMGIPFVSCDSFYETGESFQSIYDDIVEYVMGESLSGKCVCYCVPGHPMVAEDTVRMLLHKAETLRTEEEATQGRSVPEIVVLPALSFLDAAFVALGIDPIQERLSILDAAPLFDGDRSGIQPMPAGSRLFAQVYHPLIAAELKLALLDEALPDTEVVVLHHIGIQGEEKMLCCPLAELDHFREFDHLTSIYMPSTEDGESGLGRDAGAYPLDALVEVIRTLLSPDGCPWDRKQTHETLKRYLLEEAAEVVEAIDEKDMAHLKEELGDVLMQIVLHSALAEARGDFDINGVVADITEKMIRRHPHVFGDVHVDSPEEVAELWQKIKQEEKKANPS